MRVLTFTSLYPNRVTPGHGVFVENRLVHLVSSGRVTAVVVAPVPWFPFRHRRFGRFAAFAAVPHEEERFGVRVLHPRYPTLPVIASLLAPLTMAFGARAAVARLIREGERFDAIDAHYFFPDGVAAALLARWFGLPLVITARGSDINQIAHQPVARRAIVWAAGVADRLITVSAALRDALLALGVDAKRTVVLRNGVDASRFHPVDRSSARARYGLDPQARVVASVGRLHPMKGHDLAIEAVAGMPGVVLLIAGSGTERASLEAKATSLGIADRVRFVGQQAHGDLAALYSSADALVLASAHEGWPNVLLEAMACGTPVVTTRVGGTAEIVTSSDAGAIIESRSAEAVGDALRSLFAAPPDREATRRYAQRFSWDETTRGQEQLFESLLREPAGTPCEAVR